MCRNSPFFSSLEVTESEKFAVSQKLLTYCISEACYAVALASLKLSCQKQSLRLL